MQRSIETITRENDDLNLRMFVVAEQLSQRFGFRRATVQSYLSAKRKGFPSHKSYLEFRALQRGLQLSSEIKNKRPNSRYREQKKFEENMESVSSIDLDSMVGPSDLLECIEMKESLEILPQKIAELPYQWRYVIHERFYVGRTLKDIGKELGYSRENVRLLQSKALEALRRKLRVPVI